MKYIIILTAITLSACGVDEQEDPKQWDTDKDPQTNNQNNPQDKKEDPVKEDPIKKDPPIKDPTARQWVKIYRHAAYSCAIDTNNTALCDGLPPRGAAEPGEVIPLELEGVEQMALGHYGYCVLTTTRKVQCYGYKPFRNDRNLFKFLTISADDELCALGNYARPYANLICRQLRTDEPPVWFGKYFDPTTQWANFDMSRTFLTRTRIVCGVDLDGQGHCFDGTTEKADVITGPFQQLIAHTYYSLCGLSTEGQWSCWNRYSPDQKVTFEGTYKRLLSSTCALTPNDRVKCWRGKTNVLSAPYELIDPVGEPVKDFSQTPMHIFAYDAETNNHIKNWCAIDMKGQQTCAPYDNNEANGPSL